MRFILSLVLALSLWLPCYAKDYWCHIDETGDFSFATQSPTPTEINSKNNKIIKVDLSEAEIAKYMECYSEVEEDSIGVKHNKPLNRKFKVVNVKDKTFDKEKKYDKKDLCNFFSVVDSNK